MQVQQRTGQPQPPGQLADVHPPASEFSDDAQTLLVTERGELGQQFLAGQNPPPSHDYLPPVRE
jgi:hypothetical protein